jgi:hypothetical protein
MHVNPVLESEASDEVTACYVKLKKALGLPHLPLFFTYIAAFPEYLTYITDQLVVNLEDKKFLALADEAKSQFKRKKGMVKPI